MAENRQIIWTSFGEIRRLVDRFRDQVQAIAIPVTVLDAALADAATLLGLARVAMKVMEESQEDYFGADLPLLEALRDLPKHLQDAIGYQRPPGT